MIIKNAKNVGFMKKDVMRQKLLWTKVTSFIALTIAPYGKPVKLEAMEARLKRLSYLELRSKT